MPHIIGNRHIAYKHRALCGAWQAYRMKPSLKITAPYEPTYELTRQFMGLTDACICGVFAGQDQP
jgi:hypothetical protein